MTIERRHVRAGVPPTSVWTGFQPTKADKALVVLVGLTSIVEALSERLEYGSPAIRLPFATVLVCPTDIGLRKASLFGIPSSDKELSLSTLLVGYWPDFSGAKAAIDQINVHPTDGCREWETNIRKLAAAQPERIVPPKHVVDNEVIYSLCDAFLNECRRAMAS